MSFNEIKELRKSGKLDEALQKAKQLLETQPENIWNKRAISWVYYEFLKKYAQLETYDNFKEYLDLLKSLQLPNEEKMVFDNSAWQIGKIVFALQNEKEINYNKINEIVDCIKGFHFTKPLESYTFIYKAFHKGHHTWTNYLQFADWWNFDNFLPEDYLNEEYKDKKIMSIVEQAYIAYSKKLAEGEPNDSFGIQRIFDKDKIQEFLPKLNSIIENHPEYQYPPFFKAKLLLAVGDKENVLSSFIPFAKQKKNDFWVWELLAEIFPQDKEIQFSCYCKALSLKTHEDFLVKLRQTFAGILINKQLFNEAKSEILQIIATREKHLWNIPFQVSEWTHQDWYINALGNMDNKHLYAQHLKPAEELLFQDIEEELVAVEFVNTNKNILNFIKNKSKHGYFNYTGQLENPKIGDIIQVRFNGIGKEGLFKIFTAKKIKESITIDAIRKVEGTIKIIASSNIGFIEDVFVETKMIIEKKFINGQKISGKAILSYNKKREEWGWKAIEIEVL